MDHRQEQKERETESRAVHDGGSWKTLRWRMAWAAAQLPPHKLARQSRHYVVLLYEIPRGYNGEGTMVSLQTDGGCQGDFHPETEKQRRKEVWICEI